MKPPIPSFRGEATPAYDVDPTASLRLGVLAAAEAIADDRLFPATGLPPRVIQAGETYDS